MARDSFQVGSSQTPSGTSAAPKHLKAASKTWCRDGGEGGRSDSRGTFCLALFLFHLVI